MSLTQRLCEAEAKADQQRRLRQRAEEQLNEVRQSVRMQQQQASSLQQRLSQLEAGAAGVRSDLLAPQLRGQHKCVVCMQQARIDALQARNEQLERAAGQLRPSPSVSPSECCACCSAPPSVLYRPCLHLCMCEQCDRQMANNQCPLCRAPIQARLQPVRLA